MQNPFRPWAGSSSSLRSHVSFSAILLLSFAPFLAAQISVGPAGIGPETFASAPANPEGLYQIENFAITDGSTVSTTCIGITTQPQNLTVPERQPATISLTATGTPLSIQWYRKDGAAPFVPIPGADAASYTLPSPIHPADNGAQFRAVITNSLCTVTSSVATLTVIRNALYEGFETAQALDNWFAENGTWEIGRPTFGPDVNPSGERAYAGTNVAATVLDGGYSALVDSRLIGPAFVVPSAANNPRLRFWHWYEFGTANGRVELRVVGTTNWIVISPTYINTGSSVWTRPSIDLSAFAGQNVQLAFHFVSTCCTGGAGWYIDEVTVLSGPIIFNNPESWERGLGDWQAERGTWQVGSPTSGPAAYEGTNVAATVLGGGYAGFEDSRLISPFFAVPSAAQYPRLRFWHWYQFGTASGRVEARVAGTTNWLVLSPSYVNSGSGVWTRPSLDLRAFAGQNIQLAFHFTSSCCTGGEGWAIDDVAVVTGTPAYKNHENWENGLGDWHAESGAWEVGQPTSGPGAAHEGTNVAATVLAGGYAGFEDSRLISPVFTVPPPGTNPRLRCWHWYEFGTANGRVEARVVGSTNWVALSPVYVNTSGGVWTRPQIDLNAFAGSDIELAFRFTSSCCMGGAGWYIDEVRLLHEFAVTVGSTIVRTQSTACLPLRSFAAEPITNLSFTLSSPNLQLLTASLDPGTRFQAVSFAPATVPAGAGAALTITLHTHPTNGLVGDETFASLCFPANRTNSALIPVHLQRAVATAADGTTPRVIRRSGRIAIIANESLVEAWAGANGQRMLTLYGKPNTAYTIQHATSVEAAAPWANGWSGIVPSSMFTNLALSGTFSNLPRLFLKSVEQ